MKLHNLQKDFINYIKSGDITEAISNEIESNDVSNEDKLGVYRDTVYTNAINALKINYPYLQRLVGDEFFAGVANKFVEQNLPETGALAEYGDGFSGFLSTLDNIGDYEFIPDFAKMEWLIYQVGHMDVERAITAQELTYKLNLGEKFELSLTGAMKLMSSKYNLTYIYELLDSDDANEVDHDKLNQKSNYLVRKSEDGVKVFLLKKNEFWFLNTVRNGAKFQTVVEMVASEDEASSLVARLLNFKVVKET